MTGEPLPGLFLTYCLFYKRLSCNLGEFSGRIRFVFFDAIKDVLCKYKVWFKIIVFTFVQR